MKWPALRGTLFTRLAALVVMAVLASQVFTLWLGEQQKNRLLSRQLYAQVVDTLADYEGVLDSLPASQRAAFLRANDHIGLPRLLPLDDTPPRAKHVPGMGRDLAASLGKALGEPVEVFFANGERHELWLKVPMLAEHYWLVMPLARYLPPALLPTLQAAGLVALLSVLAAFALAWRTPRPLSKLVAATRELEAGRTPPPLVPSGPREVKLLIERFNGMASALEKAASERRLMLAGLSHDLRTPLTRLKLAVELQDDNTEREGMLSDIDELSRIVGQFIDFARSEEARALSPLALDELVDSVLGKFARDGMSVSFQRADATVNGDALGLQRLLSNLLQNARRYGAAPFAVALEVAGQQGVPFTHLTPPGECRVGSSGGAVAL
ncbi:histidine kinase dimerization/phospho-acceptor domain-containing protein [Vogesella oryzae]|uniref:histidine kinase dimerization/phospho-acceptor domain-containing protein n=1 Tax=Vogesella oryzae TaxID=1735285 RepID=UPI0015817F07|nr:histidine kinase dimerization/phospho-acceptor domain-containing protein [Vogesella oryzae]